MSRPPGTGRLARRLVRAAALLVPGDRRAGWREEWLAELAALETARAGPEPDPALPGPVAFALGALPHAVTTRTRTMTMESVIQDLRFAARTLLRAPAFTVVAVGTLALGIGANATIFTLVDGLILREPPGVEAPDRLVQIARSYDAEPRWDNWSWPALETIREAPVFDGVAGFTGRSTVVGSGAEASLEPLLYVTGDYFRVLRVEPALGRLLGPADDVDPGAHTVAVLDHGFWTRRFGGDPSVVGRSLLLGGRPYEVVGVAAPGFRGVDVLGATPALYVPTAQVEGFQGRLPFDEWGWSWVDVVGRLAPGVTLEGARAAMEGVTARMRGAGRYDEDVRVLLAAGVGLEPEERSEAGRLAFLLAGIAALVLLLTCANVANLFVARSTTRSGEMGVRLALGAGVGRLVRQLSTEAVVLGVGAAAVAVPLVVWASGAIPALLPYTVSVSFEPDGRVLLAVALLGLVAGLLFGALPAFGLARRDPAAALRTEGARGSTGGAGRVRDGLVVGQIAISLALVACAGLLGRSILAATRADPGFQPRGLLAASIDTGPTGRYDLATSAELMERARRGALELPGVRSATVASQAPYLGGYTRRGTWPEGASWDEGPSVEAEAIFIGEGYVETMGMRLVEGRSLRAPDREPEPVALVNEALADLFWPGGGAVGQRIDGGDGTLLRVVGVVEDVQNRTLRRRGAPTVYRPLSDGLSQRGVLLLRVGGDPLAHAGAVRRLVADLDPGVPVAAVADVHGRMTASLGATRTLGLLAALFAGLASILSSIGLYGLVAYGVAQRRREMGVRLALGSHPSALLRLVLRRALGLALVGLAVGALLASLGARALRGVLYGVDPGSVSTLGGAAALLLVTSLVAALVPAWRASRVDAAVSLRDA